MVLRRVGIWSAAKISAVLYAALGLILGVFFAIASLLGLGPAQGALSDAPPWFSASWGVAAILVFPIMYGLGGLVAGALSAGLYNLFSRLVGGVVLELQPLNPPPPLP